MTSPYPFNTPGAQIGTASVTEPLERWRKDILAISSMREITAVNRSSTPCFILGIEAESVRPSVDRELKRRGVPLDAVQVEVIKVMI